MQRIQLLLALTISVLAIGCSQAGKAKNGRMGEPVYYAYTQLKPTKGSRTEGELRFAEAFGKVKIQGEIRNLQPNSKHGFHIHQYGDCSAPDATSAGGHYSPEGHSHGAPDDEQKHVGDLGNITADKKGVAKVDLEVSKMGISSGEHPILGRGVIVHAQPDDLVSQPTGGAGARISCGVIGASGTGK